MLEVELVLLVLAALLAVTGEEVVTVELDWRGTEDVVSDELRVED